MTEPCRDGASDIVNAFITGLKQGFGPVPGNPCPPDGGSSVDVRFFAGDFNGLPSLAFEGCGDPLLWVRVGRRFRSKVADFPQVFVGDAPCGQAGVVWGIEVEIGVGRCTSMEANADWGTLATEAEISLDDSWHIEQVMCGVATRLRREKRAVATDTVAPIGPEGGLMVWTAVAFVQVI